MVDGVKSNMMDLFKGYTAFAVPERMK